MNRKRNILTILLKIVFFCLFVLISWLAFSLLFESYIAHWSMSDKNLLTRRTIRICERNELNVVTGIRDGILAKELKEAFGIVLMNTPEFRGGYINISKAQHIDVLDAWGQPLQIMIKSNLLTISNVSPKLLAKTNEIIIWSIGPNKSNEFGNGDDIFIPLSSINK